LGVQQRDFWRGLATLVVHQRDFWRETVSNGDVFKIKGDLIIVDAELSMVKDGIIRRGCKCWIARINTKRGNRSIVKPITFLEL
jgi:hypothetical protein